ncbi:sensor histidine kinase [Asanoa iriomotensis]|uniref:histidine kinase n=1 Tax=Asanoa iriomotensis TaxID=234613 RepID=A0ABQ4BUB6_9ACTN|nr:sensor histidine kinase [Asanoa iriomotensis]GIF54127.1 hypothetical protein Air01nite_02220 [Asanoa iriomotensis]
MSGWRPSRLDVLLAVAVAAAGTVEAYGRAGPGPGHVHHPTLLAAGALAGGLVLVLRRRVPIGALVALTALTTLLRAVVMDADYPLAAWQFYSNLILVHTVGSEVVRPRVRAAAVLAVLADYALLQTLPGQDLAESLIVAIFMGVAYGSGVLLRRQTARTVRMAEAAALAATTERARIARELHDVISHNVSLMTLQSGGVRLLLGTDPARDRERDLLRGVEQAGRETVEELRIMLGLLRDGTAPARLDRLDALAGPVREVGLDVRVVRTGAGRPVAPAVDLAAYRVVQEALTNSLKHAGATAVTVTVDHARDALRVEVSDDGAGTPAAGDGHGLAGMRERTALHGGTFEAGSRPGGGFTVTAVFPLAVAHPQHPQADDARAGDVEQAAGDHPDRIDRSGEHADQDRRRRPPRDLAVEGEDQTQQEHAEQPEEAGDLEAPLGTGERLVGDPAAAFGAELALEPGVEVVAEHERREVDDAQQGHRAGDVAEDDGAPAGQVDHSDDAGHEQDPAPVQQGRADRHLIGMAPVGARGGVARAQGRIDDQPGDVDQRRGDEADPGHPPAKRVMHDDLSTRTDSGEPKP